MPDKPLPDAMMGLANLVCGCATPESTWGEILSELERLEREEYRDDGLAAHIVDHLRLSEHGTSVRGGWLTEDGAVALAFLREHGIDWSADKGFFVDSDGVSHGSDPIDAKGDKP